MDNIMKILEELKNTYQCEFIIGDMIGGMASATRLTEDLYNKIKSRKSFDLEEFRKTTQTLNHGSPKTKYVEVIMVNPSLIKMYNIREECIKYIIAHEYGHIKTFHQITERDLAEYRLKVSILQSLSATDPQLAGNKHAYVYHSLKIEKLANDYAKLPVEKVAQELLKATPDPNWRSLKAMNLVNLQFDQNTFSMLNKLLQMNTADYTSFMAKNKDRVMDSYQYIFGKCIADKKIQDRLMHLMSMQIDNIMTSAVKNESVFQEDVGDIDDMKPSSDNPIQDTMLDLDRKLSSIQQSVKSKVQGVQRTASAIAKPFNRTSKWITNMVSRWKDANENDLKAKMADPHERSTLLSAFKSAIKYGSLMKAGLLLNPIIMFLTISKKWSDRKNNFRIRNEMIGELKAELEIIEEKIRDADQAQDRSAKYKLMRFRNELKKKLIRVGGTPEMKNMI